jgi:pimeloyl-ACP methyl ester carboxylesterase
MIAQELALEHPQRLASLILAGTYARADAKRRAVLDLWKRMVELKVPAEIRIKNRLAWTIGDATMEQEDLIDAMWRFPARRRPGRSRVQRQAEAASPTTRSIASIDRGADARRVRRERHPDPAHLAAARRAHWDRARVCRTPGTSSRRSLPRFNRLVIRCLAGWAVAREPADRVHPLLVTRARWRSAVADPLDALRRVPARSSGGHLRVRPARARAWPPARSLLRRPTRPRSRPRRAVRDEAATSSREAGATGWRRSRRR